MEGFNVDLPPIPLFVGMSAEDLRMEMEDYIRKLTTSLEEMFREVYKRGELVKRDTLFKRVEVDDAAYTVTSSDFLVVYTALSAGRTVTLPTSIANSGRVIIIADEAGGAAADNITIDPEGAATIEGNATLAIAADYGVARLYSDGTNWFEW